MPCLDPGAVVTTYGEQRALKEREAILCAVLTVLEKSKTLTEVLNKIDYKEGGFTRTCVENWWSEHKSADLKRRERERQKRETEKKRKAARAKLTVEERKLLGIK